MLQGEAVVRALEALLDVHGGLHPEQLGVAVEAPAEQRIRVALQLHIVVIPCETQSCFLMFGQKNTTET